MSIPAYPPRDSRARARFNWAAVLVLLAGLVAMPAHAAAPTASSVSISGPPEVGALLTGNYTYSDTDGDPEGASVFQWVRYARFGNNCFDFFSTVVGSQRQYTPTADDLDDCLVFRVTPVAQSAEDGQFQGATVTSPIFGPIGPANTAPEADDVEISGTPEVGFVLSGSYDYDDADDDPEGTSTYRWLRNGSAISGATGAQYTLVAADEGTEIQFEVTPVAQTGVLVGTPETSDEFGPIRRANTAPTVSNVTVSGTPEAGFTLTGDYDYDDADDDDEGNSTFRWLRNGAAITGATGQQYQLVAADVGTNIRFEVTPVAESGLSPGTAMQSANFGPIRPANTPPVASNVSISGTPRVGQPVRGEYTYTDADGDTEGTSRYRWLRNNNAIAGATSRDYTIVTADVGASIVFEVVPEAASGATPGAVARSAPIQVNNVPPEIVGQDPLETEEDTPLALDIDDFEVEDEDTPQNNLTLQVLEGTNYSRQGNTIRPAQDFFGELTVPVRVSDGFTFDEFNATVTVTPVNDAPAIGDQLPDPLEVPEDTPITLSLADNFIVDDPDNEFPGEFTLTLLEGENYTVMNNVVTPAENYNGNLVVGATVTDAEGAPSPEFGFRISVTPVNDEPSLVEPIADFTAIENAPVELDVSGNFTDVDGDELTYAVTWAPAQPPNLAFDADTGEFSGTPGFEDTEEPVYSVTVTAADPEGEVVSDTFQLIVSALDRANLALAIDVSPDSGQPGEQFQWTFTTTNPVGPQPGANVVVSGSFTGEGLTVTPQDAAACTIQPESALVTAFQCTVGAVPVDSSQPVVIFTTASGSSEVLATATAESIDSLPIDPNLADNTALLAVGIGSSFSLGAVQNVGAGNVLSLDAGDVNGDGRTDLVVGTSAGSAVQVFLADEPRESCDCYRDFLGSALVVPNSGSARGVKLADFTGDGILDLVVATGDGQSDMVYRNDGNGMFIEVATLGLSSANAVAVADFNGDGNADIVIAADGPNPVWLGDGAGNFTLETEIGGVISLDVAAGLIDDDALPDLVFANAGGISRIQLRVAGGGFRGGEQFNIGAASAVALGDIDGDGSNDLVFGRLEGENGGIPSNPVYLNNGNGGFGGRPFASLGLSPTRDVLIGDVNGDGGTDLVFINASGVHQVWVWNGSDLVLHGEQIIDVGGIAGVLGNFGEVAAGDEGGLDLAIGGAEAAGAGVYLNDGAGNLGRGDATAPTLELVGDNPLVLPSGGQFTDPGVDAVDDIDGDISDAVVMTGTVNTAVVGSYTVTYNVTDFAGNAAPPVTRTVTVNPATGAGGGGGGSLSRQFIAGLLVFLLAAACARRAARTRRAAQTARLDQGR